jgi:acyl-CoA thioesterase FadM
MNEWLRMLGVEQDQLVVRTRLRDHRRVRFSLDQEVRLASEDTLLCSAHCVAACIDAETFKPCRIPASLKFLDSQSTVTQQ